jgi:hypothetical protein
MKPKCQAEDAARTRTRGLRGDRVQGRMEWCRAKKKEVMQSEEGRSGGEQGRSRARHVNSEGAITYLLYNNYNNGMHPCYRRTIEECSFVSSRWLPMPHSQSPSLERYRESVPLSAASAKRAAASVNSIAHRRKGRKAVRR